MPTVVQYGGDGDRYPLHRAACQGDDEGLVKLLAALKAQQPIDLGQWGQRDDPLLCV
jgi:hypothetical protein